MLHRLAAIPHALAGAVRGWLWGQENESELWLVRIARRSLQILAAVTRDLASGQLSLRAMGLVFITFVGFFPALTLVFTVLQEFGVHNDLRPTLLAVLEPLGERSAEITDDIIGYIDALQVEFIGLTSVILLLYLVIDMLRKIEGCFNYIWCVENAGLRPRRLLGYLLTILLSPVLLLLSISISAVVNSPELRNWLEEFALGSQIPAAISFLLPLALMSVGFALMYLLIPAARVRFVSALLGGIFTALVWKLMGSVFQGLLVSSARDSIYLAFASVIAVMYFVYFGWMAALTGSNIAYYHQYPERIRSGR
ncbi:MAG: YihY/virulence factor BrkB family protein [Gammaproteobacteria bacterium]|nr:YihY/virulence factor BrkB family protein [Gammaproteobacteria bacterium]MYL14923.1 YihY/virulence factor BrkB family protein [Gammaproteobacteria bacterium]